MPRTIARALLSAAPAKAPTEFRLFARGANDTTKGTFVFDAAAAKSVMAAYRKQGVDLPIDLEHQSLSDPARPDSADARGWFKLALRNGELWAVNVTWTPDGTRRLSDRTQRYISPAFTTDEDGRVLEMINCALVAMPATHNAPALVAASRYGSKNSTPVTARLTHAMLARVENVATQRRTTVAGLIRLSLSAIAAGDSPKDPMGVLADICQALGMPADTAPADVLASVSAVVDELNAQGADPLPSDGATEHADPTPDGPPGTFTTSKLDRALAANGFSRADLARALRPLPGSPPRAKRTARVLTKAELAGCKRLGISPDEFILRAAKAVKRI